MVINNIREKWINTKFRVTKGMIRLIKMINDATDPNTKTNWCWTVCGQHIHADMIIPHLGFKGSLLEGNMRGFSLKNMGCLLCTVDIQDINRKEEKCKEMLERHWEVHLKAAIELADQLEMLQPPHVYLAIDKALEIASE